MLTFNHRDFAPLAQLWYETGQQHAGIILSTQLSRGELLRLLRNLLSKLTANEMANTVRWLQEFR